MARKIAAVAAAALTVVALAGPPASATTPPAGPVVTVDTSTCGTAVLSVKDLPAEGVRVEYRVGRSGRIRTLPPQGAAERFREDSGPRFIQWRTVTIGDDGTERPGHWSKPVRAETNCHADVDRDVKCGVGKLTVRASAVRPAWLQWREDDGPVRGLFVAKGRTKTATFGPYEEDSGTHVGFYRLRDGDWGRWRRLSIPSGCRPEPEPTPTVTVTAEPTPAVVVPAAPVIHQPTCDTPARIVIPDVPGVVYLSASGSEVQPGAYVIAPGEHKVTAKALPGYALAEGAASEWLLTVAPPPGDCTPDEDGGDDSDARSIRVIINQVPVPVRVDTGLGGTA